MRWARMQAKKGGMTLGRRFPVVKYPIVMQTPGMSSIFKDYFGRTCRELLSPVLSWTYCESFDRTSGAKPLTFIYLVLK